MPWLKVDDKFSRGRKVKRAANALGGRHARARVLAVWVDAMSYCAMHLTDGFYPDFEMDELPDQNPRAVFTAMALGDTDLGAIVERDDTRGGWVFRNYAEYQPTRADVEEKLDWDRRRKALYSIPGLVDAIRRRDRDRCRYCGIEVNWKDRRSPKGGTYDHIQPRGDNSYENVVVACHQCNVRKGGRTPEQARMPLIQSPDEVVTSSGTSSDLCYPDPSRSVPSRSVPTPEHTDASRPTARPGGAMGGTETVIDGRWMRTHGQHRHYPRACQVGACIHPSLDQEFAAALSVCDGRGPDGRTLDAFYADTLSTVERERKPVSDTFRFWRAAFERWLGPIARVESRGNRAVSAGQRLEAALRTGATLDTFGVERAKALEAGTAAAGILVPAGRPS